MLFIFEGGGITSKEHKEGSKAQASKHKNYYYDT